MRDKSDEQIIREAFAKGEAWGVAHSTWFNSTEDHTEEQVQRAIKEITGDRFWRFIWET